MQVSELPKGMHSQELADSTLASVLAKYFDNTDSKHGIFFLH